MSIQALKKILILPFLLVSSYSFSQSVQELHPILKNNKLGFIDARGKIVVEPQFDEKNMYPLGAGREDLINVNTNGKKGVLNTEEKLVIPTIYDSNPMSFNFNGGNISPFYLSNKCGYITDQNQKIINEKYQECNPFNENRASVKLKNKWALINEKGELLTAFIYDEIGEFSEGLANVSIDGKYGFIDHSGKVVIPLNHEMAMPFENGLSRIGSLSSSYYFINKSGKKVFDVQYSHVYTFETDYAIVRQDVGSKELYGLINLNGETIIKPQYKDLKLNKLFPDLAIIANKSGKYGVVNIKINKVVIQPKYQDLSFSTEGLITFSEKNKSGLIDLNEKIILPAKFDQGSLGFDKNQQLSLVKINGQLMYVDRKGNKISDYIID